ncbi:MAG: multifunctional 2-oxoglutarate metabolism enzyme [Frankiaceae bacterium]|nr:multifunctional 2-oxoglutarate metabolism enzyme [Frankiaceae bacterium]
MTTESDPRAGFGPNEWLVYEIYQQFLADPDSVDRSWWDYFDGYTPPAAEGDGGPNGQGAPSPAAQAVQQSPDGPVDSPAAPPPPVEAVDAPAIVAPAAPQPVPETASAATPTASPTAPTAPATAPVDAAPAPAAPEATAPAAPAPETKPLRGVAARIVTNMEASLGVPTATSVRQIPAKLLIDNRTVINNHLRRGRGGKVSFTHLIGYALVKAIADVPSMNNGFTEVDGKPALLIPQHVNLGLAIDISNKDGSRSLVVPSIKAADTMDFAAYFRAYEDIVKRARTGGLTIDDYAGTTVSLTNPGTLGTVSSVPRLMQGQGCIVGVGAMDYPAEYQGASLETLARLAVSKVMTLTSTYDHRIIQGAQSGEFLRRMHQLLLGEGNFYDEVFASLRIPYEPIRWVSDVATSDDDEIGKQARVIELIHAYRVRGHRIADTNPLEFQLRRHPDLDIVNHGLTLWDLDREFVTGGFAGKQRAPLREILGVLRDTYCRTTGIEYMHLQDPVQRAWLQARVEVPHEKISRDEQLRILSKLNEAEAFETFLQTKYVGQKRFSLEGGESMIPLLDSIATDAARAGLDEVCIGMPHRGRLNVLTNIVGKSYGQIFAEFEGNIDPKTAHGSGDVKYHLGARGTFTSYDDAKIAVSLASNPSHLEAVNPVLEGIVRAKQDVLNKFEEFPVLAVLLHGDAAFAGQGVVAETLELSQLRGYRTGGTMHVVVNNQVGFTTSPTSSRSSVYATDVARMVQAPIFHVNGDDPEAVVRVAELAFEYRQAFNKDVVIDLVCYRRRGHSEVDEPSFTQPLMYDLIEGKRSVRKLYTEALIGRGDITIEEAEEALRHYQDQLEKVFSETRGNGHATGNGGETAAAATPALPTATSLDVMRAVARAQTAVPEGFTVHQRLLPQLAKRLTMLDDDAVDWAMAEATAFGSLLLQGIPVRLAGQDSRRGTFGHRHAVLVDRNSGAEFTPLKHLGPNGEHTEAPFYVYDSLLSEFAAMGFEYGYSVARPEALVIWEAQFGDFANGAQTIVDEFISSGEAKWGQRSGVTLLLPHGYEGQGPDHSSARIERYLTLCAENNMTVALPTEPANYFHLLRRQALAGLHRPLVVFTPKSPLRLKAAASPVSSFTSGDWRPIIMDPEAPVPSACRRVLLCSGKLYWELAAARRNRGVNDVAIVRMEQLYPLPGAEVRAAIEQFNPNADIAWVQEEPANMGPWPFVALNLPEHLPGGRMLRRISRPASASPATGSSNVHQAEQNALLDAALG